MEEIAGPGKSVRVKKKIKVWSEYQAATYTTCLRILCDEPKNGNKPLFTKRKYVGKFSSEGSMTLFVNRVCKPEEADLVVFLRTEYTVEYGDTQPTPYLWHWSKSNTQEGVLAAVPLGFEFFEENRGGVRKKYAVTTEGIVEVEAKSG